MNPRLKQNAAGNTSKNKAAGPTPAELLARMPRRPLTPEQQIAALEKVQQQATQRVKLGQQLFEAADARLKQHQDVLKNIQDQQQVLREQVQEDVAKSLQSYDQWMGKIDESFTGSIKQLNERIDQLELRVDASRGELEAMLDKASALMSQTQSLVAEAFEDNPPQTGSAPTHNERTTADIARHAEPLDTIFDITPDDEAADAFGACGSIDEEAATDDDQASADVLAEMQRSVPEDPHCDIDELGLPSVEIDVNLLDRNTLVYEADADILEVEIMPAGDNTHNAATDPSSAEPAEDGMFAQDPPADDDEDDVFGEVLRRLRKQAEENDHDAAA